MGVIDLSEEHLQALFQSKTGKDSKKDNVDYWKFCIDHLENCEGDRETVQKMLSDLRDKIKHLGK